MTASFFRVTTIVLTAVGLAGCIDARPQYAPYEGYVSPPPYAPLRRPQYPISEAPGPARVAEAAPPAVDPDGSAPRAASTNRVQSQGLPPVQSDTLRRDPMRFDSGRSPYLVPLVWRQDTDQAGFVEVARHHHLRPEIDASPSSSKRGRRHAAEESAPTQTVTVKKGDTINSIARRFHTTPKAIMEANQGSRPKALKIGDELQVPAPDSAPAAAKGRRARAADASSDSGRETRSSDADTGRGRKAKARKAAGYVVKHGDTLYSIARRNDVTVEQLKDLNHLRSASLHSGQKLKLPGQVEEAPPEERPARAARAPRPAPTRRSAPPPSDNAMSGSAFQTPPAPAPVPAPTPAPAQLPPPAEAAIGPSHPVPYSSMPGALPPQTPPARPRPSASYLPPPQPTYAPPPAYTAPPAASASPSEAPVAPTDAQVASAGKGRFIWPTHGSLLIGFGPMAGGQRNDGLDIAAPDGSPVRASAAGDVVYAGNLVPGFGNLVLIKHEDGWVTAYAHLGATEVKIRDHVAQGAEIGTVGSSGGVAQPQLHFEVRYAPSPRERARPIDPALVLPVGQ